MPASRTCAVPWCTLIHPETSPGQTFILHERTIAGFANGGITIDVETFLGETVGQQLPACPDVLVLRQDVDTISGIRLSPGDACDLAQILGGLAPMDVLRFARALVKAAGAGEQTSITQAA